MNGACANLRPGVLLLVVAAGCSARTERVFAWVGSAPSLVGLTATPAGAVTVSEVGAATCLSPTGELRWRSEVCRPVRHRPALVGGSLWVACDDGTWAAIDAKTGRLRWKVTGRRAPAGPLASDGPHGYLASADGTVEAVDETGQTLWAGRGGPHLTTAADVVIAADPEHGVVALDASSGERRWADAAGALAVDANDEAVVAAHSGDLTAWRASTGERLWTVAAGPFIADTLAVEGSAVTVGLQTGELLSLSLSDGAAAGRRQLPGLLAAPARDGVALLQGREGCAALLTSEPPRTVCADHQLRGNVLVRDGVLMLAPRDGRIIGIKVAATAGGP